MMYRIPIFIAAMLLFQSSWGATNVSSKRTKPNSKYSITNLPAEAINYRNVVQSKDLEEYSQAAMAMRRWYVENDPYKPLYHFTAPECWISDPNGPIYFDGLYHIFYQHNPMVADGQGSWKRGDRCWGHAVSSDLVHWRDYPIAIWADSKYDTRKAASGNTFIHDAKIHALYTGNVNQREETYGMLAWSNDGGVTFEKKMVMPDSIKANKYSPVHWDAQIWREGDVWHQLIGGTTEDNTRGVAWLWKSDDLEQWTLQRNIAPSLDYREFWELPYLIQFEEQYILMVGGGARYADNPYWIGEYDKEKMLFTPTTPVRLVDATHYYSFNPHMVDNKGEGGAERRIMHGWAKIGAPRRGAGELYWENAHSIPRVITLKDDRLHQEPIEELKMLRYNESKRKSIAVDKDSLTRIDGVEGDALEIKATIKRGRNMSRFSFIVRADEQGEDGTTIWIDNKNLFGVDELSNENFLSAKDNVDLHIFIDRGIIEIYCDGVAVTHSCFAPKERVAIFALSEGDRSVITEFTSWKMKPMWE